MGENLGFWSGIRVAITGVFVASLMPFNAGGEPMQIYLLRNEGLSMGQASAVCSGENLLQRPCKGHSGVHCFFMDCSVRNRLEGA